MSGNIIISQKVSVHQMSVYVG